VAALFDSIHENQLLMLGNTALYHQMFADEDDVNILS